MVLNINTGSKPISTLNDEEIVKLFNLFDIIKFINPKAICALLEDKILLQKYTTIYGISTGRTFKKIKIEFDERPSPPPIDRMMNCMYDYSSKYVCMSKPQDEQK